MKQGIVFLFFISFLCVSFGQEITYKKQQPCDFIIHYNDIEHIDIDIDTIIEQYNRYIPDCLWHPDTIYDSMVILYKVKVYLTDDCIFRITNADWSVLCSVLIENSDFSIVVFRHIESLMLLGLPTLYNYSPDRTKFVMFNLKYLQFSFSAEFAQCYPSFLNTLISIQKKQSAEEYNDPVNSDSSLK